MRPGFAPVVTLTIWLAGAAVTTAAPATERTHYNDHDKWPHSYRDVELHDPVTVLQDQINRGLVTLTGGSDQELLGSVLRALGVPVSSQIIVFSKTSLQRRNISRENPRAMYFNEDVYVTYVPGGFLEIISIDPTHGGIFWVLKSDGKGSHQPFERRFDCLGCHGGDFTEFLPGLMQESRFVSAEGRSLGMAEPHWPGHGIPFPDRWGGWFVTGQHGLGEHLGNTVATRGANGIKVDMKRRAVLKSLDEFYDPDLHLTRGSDVVALLLHDHQIGFANRVMETHYRLRSVLNTTNPDSPEANAIVLDQEDQAMVKAQVEELLEYTLFKSHPQLKGGIQESNQEFLKAFAAGATLADDGSSLRQFDLEPGSYLFRNRLSYMIYTDAFLQFPKRFRSLYFSRLAEVLTGSKDKGFDYLSRTERARILRIVSETVEQLPPEFSL